MLGDRITNLLSFDALRLAAAAMLLSPYVPMLFMGEEYGEEAPFLYFVSHSDPSLVEAVRKGRKAEFAAFAWMGEAPDPQAEETFQQSKLQWNLRKEGEHQHMLQWYKELLQLRKNHPALQNPDKKFLEVNVIQKNIISIHRWQGANHLLCFLNCTEETTSFKVPGDNTWQPVLDSADTKFGGSVTKIPQQIQGGNSIRLYSYGVIVFEVKKNRH